MSTATTRLAVHAKRQAIATAEAGAQAANDAIQTAEKLIDASERLKRDLAETERRHQTQQVSQFTDGGTVDPSLRVAVERLRAEAPEVHEKARIANEAIEQTLRPRCEAAKAHVRKLEAELQPLIIAHAKADRDVGVAEFAQQFKALGPTIARILAAESFIPASEMPGAFGMAVPSIGTKILLSLQRLRGRKDGGPEFPALPSWSSYSTVPWHFEGYREALAALEAEMEAPSDDI